MKRVRSLPILLLLLAVTPLRGATDAAAVVAELHADLIAAMQGGMAYDERARFLRERVEESFDLTTISRLALGANWNAISKGERERFTALMTTLVVNTYASQFRHYGGETFETEETVPMSAGRVQVRARLTTATGERVDLIYLLRANGEEWRIFDIIARGVSDLALKRATYADLFASGGIERVMAAVEAGAEALAGE